MTPFDCSFRMLTRSGRSKLLFLISLMVVPALFAQRLPDTALPEHYALRLTPSLDTATFKGEETIDLRVMRPVDSITLNAVDLTFDHVTTSVDGKTLTAVVSLDPAKQQATFRFPQILRPGPLSLEVSYSGVLNSELRGFYLSKTATRSYAVTQFEPTSARRAFPSFDEPALKATFDVTLVVSQGDTAISNTNIVADKPGPLAGQHTIQFARTPRMSTYLLAFLVGDFQCLSGASDGVPIRACATPEHAQDGAYALSVAEFVLHYYDTYFGIKYPMPKLDLIALPDFEAGAMENFGAITFREPLLLLNPKTASLDDEGLVAGVVAHEMAHQWFGDMVTMEWWDNIWLNEGFASWMSGKPLAAWKPDRYPRLMAAGVNGTLDLDARTMTRAIRATVDTPQQINEMFDGITYGKASVVLSIVENYVGEETFRKGVHAYLASHMYGNATAEDFWNALTAVSGKPVDKIMASLVTQPGEPLLTFGPVRDGKVQVSQRRFFLNPRTKVSSNEVWTLPVCMKTRGKPVCELLSDRTQTLKVPSSPVFFPNAGGKGYYRIQYDPAEYQELVKQAETSLDQEDRIALLGNQWALTHAGEAPIGDYLRLVETVKDDSSLSLVQTIAAAIESIDQRLISSDEDDRLLAAWVQRMFTGPLQRLGQPNPQDTPEKKEFRAALFSLVGEVGNDPAILARARELTDGYLSDPGSVDRTLAASALRIAARSGDAEFYERLQKISETAANPQLHIQALRALAIFRDPTLVERTLQYAVSGKVRNQDSIRLIVAELSDRHTRDRAWQFVEENWPKVQAQLTTSSGGYLVASTSSFCSEEKRQEITNFFAAHPVGSSKHALDIAESNINDCIEFGDLQKANLKQWLDSTEESQASADPHSPAIHEATQAISIHALR